MPAEISDNVLYDVYLKPWRAYARAGGRGIMAAHNEVRRRRTYRSPSLHPHCLCDTMCASRPPVRGLIFRNRVFPNPTAPYRSMGCHVTETPSF
jgi:hypothetical protein